MTYLGHFFEARPLSTLVHVHGALFTSWILLFLSQTELDEELAAGEFESKNRSAGPDGPW
jgi:hypothetical protein